MKPTKTYEQDCPQYVEAALLMIREELDRIRSNQGEHNSPFGNTGARFDCETFSVHAYDWTETFEDEASPQEFNFKWRDLRIRWYKWCGRGMRINRAITPDECAEMLSDCLAALERMEEAIDEAEDEREPRVVDRAEIQRWVEEDCAMAAEEARKERLALATEYVDKQLEAMARSGHIAQPIPPAEREALIQEIAEIVRNPA